MRKIRIPLLALLVAVFTMPSSFAGSNKKLQAKREAKERRRQEKRKQLNERKRPSASNSKESFPHRSIPSTPEELIRKYLTPAAVANNAVETCKILQLWQHQPAVITLAIPKLFWSLTLTQLELLETATDSVSLSKIGMDMDYVRNLRRVYLDAFREQGFNIPEGSFEEGAAAVRRLFEATDAVRDKILAFHYDGRIAIQNLQAEMASKGIFIEPFSPEMLNEHFPKTASSELLKEFLMEEIVVQSVSNPQDCKNIVLPGGTYQSSFTKPKN